MEPGALQQVLTGLASDHAAGNAPGAAVCVACAAVLDTTGAGIMFRIGEQHHGSLGSSDAASALVEELQFTLGEGPCVDAYTTGRPVSEPDLTRPARPRWPAFSPTALDAGIRAVFAFPLHVGAVRLGALDLHSDHVGELGAGRLADALVIAAVITRALLDLQSTAPSGGLAPELSDAVTLRIQVHQASGMVSAQAGISVAEALIRLRARAYAESRPIDEIAREVIAKRLRID